MEASDASKRRPGAVGRKLSRAVVVRAALDHIDRHGQQRLTMRALGEDLGVEAMSLYRYVQSRQDLLEAVVAALLAELRGGLDGREGWTWQRYLQTLARAVRRLAIDHPNVFPLMATLHPDVPWLRPPLSSPDLVEDLLSTLSEQGFTDHQVVNAYQTFTSFLLGHMLTEATRQSTQVRTDPHADLTGGGVAAAAPGPRERPTIARMSPLLVADRGTEDFEQSLGWLLDRVQLGLAR